MHTIKFQKYDSFIITFSSWSSWDLVCLSILASTVITNWQYLPIIQFSESDGKLLLRYSMMSVDYSRISFDLEVEYAFLVCMAFCSLTIFTWNWSRLDENCSNDVKPLYLEKFHREPFIAIMYPHTVVLIMDSFWFWNVSITLWWPMGYFALMDRWWVFTRETVLSLVQPLWCHARAVGSREKVIRSSRQQNMHISVLFSVQFRLLEVASKSCWEVKPIIMSQLWQNSHFEGNVHHRVGRLLCRDSVEMQYMLIQKKSPKQLTYKPL